MVARYIAVIRSSKQPGALDELVGMVQIPTDLLAETAARHAASMVLACIQDHYRRGKEAHHYVSAGWGETPFDAFSDDGSVIGVLVSMGSKAIEERLFRLDDTHFDGQRTPKEIVERVLLPRWGEPAPVPKKPERRPDDDYFSADVLSRKFVRRPPT